MRFRNGYKIKPDVINKNGIVTFTDGTNTGLLANQVTCEAYGYTYLDGVCCAYKPSPELLEGAKTDTSVVNNGANNSIEKSSGTIVSGR